MNTTPRRRDQQHDHHDLAEMLPAPGRPVLAQDRHRVLREHLMAHITHEATTEQSGATHASPAAPEHRRPERRPAGLRLRVPRLALVAAPLALVAVVGVGVAAVDGARDGQRGTAAATAGGRSEAARLLDRIALAAAERPSVTVRDDQYVYTKSQGSAAELGVEFSDPKELAEHKGLFTVPQYKGAVRQEEWQSVDGRQDGLRKGVAVADPSRRMTMGMKGVGYLTFRQLQALPTDPDALLKRLYGDAAGVEPKRRAEVALENIGAVMDSATLLPDLSAALYRVMAELPGARVVDHVKDAAGRAGVGVTFAGSPKGYAWVFDASSLKYLGTTESALLDVGVTDTKGEKPTRSS